jgi:glycosyltransferase involved in cell wall biosynthesis
MRTPLSCCIIAMDEEDRIEACLDSVAFCDEIVLVDSHSTDRTADIAAARGGARARARLAGPRRAEEFAIRQGAARLGSLCVDADERVTRELRAEIEAPARARLPGLRGLALPTPRELPSAPGCR